MKQALILIAITGVISAIIVWAVKNSIYKKDVKEELGIYPKEFESKIYNPIFKKTSDTLYFDLGENITPATIDKPGALTFGTINVKVLKGLWPVEWAYAIADKQGLKVDKDYGVMIGSKEFWVEESKYPIYLSGVKTNVAYVMETKGIDTNNLWTKRPFKTALMDNHGIEYDNKYFQKLFNKYNK